MTDAYMTSCSRQYVVAGFAPHASLPSLSRTKLRECAFCDVRRSVATTVCKVTIERSQHGRAGSKSTRSCASSAAELPSAASTPSTTARHQYHVELFSSISDIDSDAWNALARAGTACPFLEHDWLRCLEESGCASPRNGWIPRHMALRRQQDNDLVALCPMYLKTHSAGEFVFDNAWAEAGYSIGVDYYPKLCVAVPFTPATGRRILTKGEGLVRKELLHVCAKALVQVCDQMVISSIHVLFCELDEADAFESAQVGFMRRVGLQYHWNNARSPDAKGEKAGGQYSGFDDYLSEWNSKKRIKIRRERRRVHQESGLDIQILLGDQISDTDVTDMFEIYKSTIDKQEYGRQYLSLKFFQLLAQATDFRKHLCFVMVRESDGNLIAGTFNVRGGSDDVLYGRYWGCTAPREVPFLHFETCYYSAIEYCIRHRISRIEPGSGGGDFKFARGFDPATTLSLHYVANGQLCRAIKMFLGMEGSAVAGSAAELQDERRLKRVQKQNQSPEG